MHCRISSIPLCEQSSSPHCHQSIIPHCKQPHCNHIAYHIAAFSGYHFAYHIAFHIAYHITPHCIPHATWHWHCIPHASNPASHIASSIPNFKQHPTSQLSLGIFFSIPCGILQQHHMQHSLGEASHHSTTCSSDLSVMRLLQHVTLHSIQQFLASFFNISRSFLRASSSAFHAAFLWQSIPSLHDHEKRLRFECDRVSRADIINHDGQHR